MDKNCKNCGSKFSLCLTCKDYINFTEKPILDFSNGFAVSEDELKNPFKKQVDGKHYKKLKIQPIEYIHSNQIPFAEGSVIKYVTRWRDKGGIKDLEKAKHFIELLIELENKWKE